MAWVFVMGWFGCVLRVVCHDVGVVFKQYGISWMFFLLEREGWQRGFLPMFPSLMSMLLRYLNTMVMLATIWIRIFPLLHLPKLLSSRPLRTFFIMMVLK